MFTSRKMTVRDLMQSRPVFNVTADTCIGEVTPLLTQHPSALIGVQEDGQFVGVYSHRLMMRDQARSRQAAQSRPLSGVADRRHVCIHPGFPLHRLSSLFAAGGCKMVLVVADDLLLGAVVHSELTQFLCRELHRVDRECQALRHYIGGAESYGAHAGAA